MKLHVRRLFVARVLALILTAASVACAQQLSAESNRIDRLVALAKLWAAVKYFHPYLAYRTDIDWDQALVQTIPKVNAAHDSKDYSAAIEFMLEQLNDPVTRVLDAKTKSIESPTSSAERQPTFRTNSEGILIVSMTRYADFTDFVGSAEKLQALKKELPNARAVVFDLRPDTAASDFDQGYVSYAFAGSGIAEDLATVSLNMPSERRRKYLGYAPQDGSTSGGYSSGFYLQGRPSIKPGVNAKHPAVVFLINRNSDLPDLALGLQASGNGAIVSEGSFSDEVAVTTQTIDLPDGVRARIRLGELVYSDGTSGFQPNLTVPVSTAKGEQNSALQAALQLAKTGTFTAPSRSPLVQQATPQPDKSYDDMQYPPAEYRLLASFRVWAVINYFFPYKDLMGEDWDAALRQFIPRMEGAKDALDYQLAVAEMVTHIHDSHGSVRSALLVKYFGEASAPIRVRMIENAPVITGFTDAQAAKEAGLEIGDIILKVDGVDAGQRIADRLRYLAHSTPQAGMFYATERSLARGSKDSVVTYTVRDLQDQVREVKVQRKAEYLPKTQGDRTGDILRLLPGNVGYADLDRLPVTLVDEMFDKFKDCSAIIFDDRGYPQGTAWQIAPRLTDKQDVVAAIFRRLDPDSPDFPLGEEVNSIAASTFEQRLPRTDKPRYHGRTVLLIDERTISQAEHTGLFLESANNTKFIGSPTQGANGDVTNFSVPGGMSVRFSGQGVRHADGRQLQRIGLEPLVEVRPTVAGIRAGKDEVLDKAVDYLSHGPQ
jgi:C-terminal processing protease CtpA/Prc